MCSVSMIGDMSAKRLPEQYPWVPGIHPYKIGPGISPNSLPNPPYVVQYGYDAPTRAEFDALKAEMEQLKKLLIAAKEYDTATGQADCEVEEKVAILKRFAELVGVDLKDVFG
jgi:hypothetical protein